VLHFIPPTANLFKSKGGKSEASFPERDDLFAGKMNLGWEKSPRWKSLVLDTDLPNGTTGFIKSWIEVGQEESYFWEIGFDLRIEGPDAFAVRI